MICRVKPAWRPQLRLSLISDKGDGRQPGNGFRAVVLTALLLVLGGCSLRLTYGFLDWWLLWQVEDYLTLNHSQQQQLEQSLKQFHQWHRQHELPRYAALAEEAAQLMAAPRISREQLQQIEAQAVELWQASLERLLPAGTQLLVSLSNDQLGELAESLADARAEFAKDYVEPPANERLHSRRQRLEETLESLLGDLTPAQQQQLAVTVSRLQESAALALAHREQEHGRFLKLLERRQQPGFAVELASFVRDHDVRRPPQLQQAYDHNGALVQQLVVELHASLSPSQRQHLNRYLLDHQEIFLELARASAHP